MGAPHCRSAVRVVSGKNFSSFSTQHAQRWVLLALWYICKCMYLDPEKKTSIHILNLKGLVNASSKRMGFIILYISRIIPVHLRYCEKSIRGETLHCYGKSNVLPWVLLWDSLQLKFWKTTISWYVTTMQFSWSNKSIRYLLGCIPGKKHWREC